MDEIRIPPPASRYYHLGTVHTTHGIYSENGTHRKYDKRNKKIVIGIGITATLAAQEEARHKPLARICRSKRASLEDMGYELGLLSGEDRTVEALCDMC